ncbi:WD repeat [Cryptosporidium bovis]|uniref:WD repeat n=1 Tax=Cryptosporidium bovis TaxID=310047 RepID=UPI00351A262A|nr:WD repeat [Cryptosporidium bovis]
MDSNKQLLVTASGDETIKIYNLKTRCDNGVLSKHKGSVTSVVISTNGKYMISCGEDKLVCLWRCSDWEPLLSIDDCHKYTPVSADFHPSMRLALTLDVKGNICLINLLEGKITGKYNLTAINDKNNKLVTKYNTFYKIKFNNDGKYYAVISQKNFIISSILNEKLYVTLSNDVYNIELSGSKQITCFTWITNNHFITGFSDGNLKLFMIYDDKLTPIDIEFKVNLESFSVDNPNPHEKNRIKGIKIIRSTENNNDIKGILVSCDSSGIFALFKFHILIENELDKVCPGKCIFDILDIYTSENRIICMTIQNKPHLISNQNSTLSNNAMSKGENIKLIENTNKKTKKSKKVNKITK